MVNKPNLLIDSLSDEFQHNISTKLAEISNREIVIYILILVGFIFISRLFNLSLSTIFFIVIALVIIYIYYSKQRLEHPSIETDLNTKIKLIIPEPKRLSPNYPDLVNFLYDVKSYYFLNMDAFYSLISNVDNFIQLYEEIMQDRMVYCVENLEVSVNFARSAQNDLQSIIYGLSSSSERTNRFHSRLAKFQSIMNTYITRLGTKCNRNFSQKNNQSKFYQLDGPKPFNYFGLTSGPERGILKTGSNQFEFF